MNELLFVFQSPAFALCECHGLAGTGRQTSLVFMRKMKLFLQREHGEMVTMGLGQLVRSQSRGPADGRRAARDALALNLILAGNSSYCHLHHQDQKTVLDTTTASFKS